MEINRLLFKNVTLDTSFIFLSGCQFILYNKGIEIDDLQSSI